MSGAPLGGRATDELTTGADRVGASAASVETIPQTKPVGTRRVASRAARAARRASFPLLGLVVILGLWQGIISLLGTPVYVIPKPTDVLASLVERGDLLFESALRTATASAAGLGMAVVLGMVGAVLLGFSRVLERSLFQYAIVLQTTPIVAIAPIIIIWIGAGMRAIILVAFIISFFPVLSNTLVGLHSTDSEVRDWFRLHNASRWQTMWKLRLPTAMPYVMAGIRISGGLAVIGAIVGEFVAGVGGGRGGLGYVIQVSSKTLDTPYLVAGALAGSTMGILFYLVTARVSKWVLAWHESVRPEEERQELSLMKAG